jgi:hypothetical protein
MSRINSNFGLVVMALVIYSILNATFISCVPNHSLYYLLKIADAITTRSKLLFILLIHTCPASGFHYKTPKLQLTVII